MVKSELTNVRTSLKRRTGFTLTELSVLMGVGAILASVVAADLNQARTKLLQQACAANLKHWGMAFSMYADDYNGTIYYDVNGVHFTDNGTPLQRYFGNSSDPLTTLRTMRICPSRIGQVSFTSARSYSMPIGTYHKGFSYANADMSGSPFYGGVLAPYWPNLKACPNGPANFLLLFDSNGHTVHCGGLVNAVSTVIQNDSDQLPAINRHGGSVNCLFGDFHVELISAQVLSNQDTGCTFPGNSSWSKLN